MALMTVVIIGILLIILFSGAPVQASLGFAAFAGIMLFMDPIQIMRFGAVAYTQSNSQNMMIAPLFLIMAEFLSKGRIASDIYDVLAHALRRIKGGLAVATTLASTVFAAMCGSSVATAATLGRISISSMISKGYRQSFATGTVAAGGTLGIMIPPSGTFILFGIITETSIAKLLISGLLPGLMLSAMFCIYILVSCRLKPSLYDGTELREKEEKERSAALTSTTNDLAEQTKSISSEEAYDPKKAFTAIPAGILIVVVIGTMYTGFATPTESAGFGAVGAVLIILVMRRFSVDIMKDSVSAAVKTTCMMVFMAIMGLTLSYIVSYLGIAQAIAGAIAGSGTNRWTVMILLFVLWLVLGALMDPGSMVLLTIPFIFSTLMKLGFDPIWVGVVSTLMTEVGMITPPIGLNLFVLGTISGVPMREIIKGALPYVGVLLLGLVILCFFPQIALFLPSRM
jgi:tripartite ATP-independent transporter DctM subunit